MKKLPQELVLKKVELYLSMGLYVVPGAPEGKFPYNGLLSNHPTVSYDVKDYPDRMSLSELFKKHPNSNIVALNGNGFLLVIIDIDKRDGKFTNDGLAMMEILNDYPTYVVETPSGGFHYYYWIDATRPLIGKIIGYKDKIDILLNGCAPLPPSIAWSDKKGASGGYGEYTERDSIELQPIVLFPYNEFPDLIDTSENRSKLNLDKRERIQEQLKKETISESRNDTLHHLSLKLIKTFPEDPKLAWKIINSFYEMHIDKKDFPLKELETTFNSALNSKIAKEAKSNPLNQPGSWLNPITKGQLLEMDLPPLEWLMEGILRTDSIAVLSGDPSSFKTWLLLDLANTIATSGLWLGQFKTKQCKVWIIDKESNLSKLKDRWFKLSTEARESILISSDVSFILTENNWDKVLEKAQLNNVKMIMLDSMRRVFPESENDSEATNKLFSVISKCRHLGITVLLTHHHRKKVRDGFNDPLSMIRGSSDILANLDTHLVVEKAQDQSLLKITPNKIKDGEPIEPFAAKIKMKDGKFSFEYAGDAKQFIFESPKESTADKAINHIKSFVSSSISCTKEEIIQNAVDAGYSHNAAGEAFKSLKSSQWFEELPTNAGGGKEVIYYKKKLDLQD